MEHMDSIYEKLQFIYGEPAADECLKQLKALVHTYTQEIAKRKAQGGYGGNLQGQLTQKDVVLITYADQIAGNERCSSMGNLKHFADKYLKELVTTIHLLPFFPYSSDDGFSVIDYCKVNEEMGSWADIDNLTENFRLMFDYVANHMSAKSEWFQKFLQGDTEYENFYSVVTGEPDLSQVVRPRAHPLLTAYEKEGEAVNVWTTFSADQVDLNYANPKVFLIMSKILLEYYLRGASLVRLDAILYMWKTIGTDCVHLPQTHAIIQIWRDLTELVLPEGVVLAEVSAPHVKNMTYLGNGTNECNMIYQFPLAPLTLYSFLKQDASIMTQWASGLSTPTREATFFNLLACHDGIGVMPARGILPEEEILWLADEVKKRGGDVSYKANSDGSQSPYELNIVYRDAICDTNATLAENTQRFLCAYAIIMAMRGVPGIYIHALLGSHNAPEEVAKTGMKRSINRKKFEIDTLIAEIQDENLDRAPVLRGFSTLLRVRKETTAFEPYGDMQIIDVGKECFVIARKSSVDSGVALALHNVTAKPVTITVKLADLANIWGNIPQMLEAMFSKCTIETQSGALIWTLPAYGYEWIAGKD